MLCDISIHALREEGDGGERHGGVLDAISIHALREEGDKVILRLWSIEDFISIHALREEGDTTMPWQPTAARYFYPRPPRGGRPGPVTYSHNGKIFLSTPSARRATSASITPTVTHGRFLSTPSARRATL